MLDKRFLDIRLSVQGFLASPPGSTPAAETSWIVSAPWGDAYPQATVNSIATYHLTYVNGTRTFRWVFMQPNVNTTMEIINLATREVLKYQKISSNVYGWAVIGHLTGLSVPFVVDYVCDKSLPINSKDNIGHVYAVSNLDNNTSVYKIISEAEGDKGRKVLGTLSLGQEIVSKSNDYFYVVKTKTVKETNPETEEETEKVVNYLGISSVNDGTVPTIPTNTLIISTETKNIYFSNKDRKLSSLTPNLNTDGENQGVLTTQYHVFTAEELTARKIVFNDSVLETSLPKTMCFTGGGVHMYSVDFSARKVGSQLWIEWRDNHNWCANPPAVGEIGIFMYFKE